MVTFVDVFTKFVEVGGMELAAFVLVFTIAFAILQKSQLFGDEGEAKKFNVIISLILGILVIVPHIMGLYPPGGDVVEIIFGALPNVALVIMMIVSLFLILGLLGANTPHYAGGTMGVIALLAFLLVSFIFARASGWDYALPNFLSWLDDPDTQALLVVLGVFAIIIWYITKKDDSGPSETYESAKRVFGKVGEGITPK